MLKLAVRAGLPLVEVTTRDMLNFADVVHHVTGKKPVSWGQPSGPAELKGGTLYYMSGSKLKEIAYHDVYKRLVMVESTLLLINSDRPHELPFKAGEVPVPRELMLGFIKALVTDDKRAKDLLAALGGCTLKETAEIVKLTMARDHSLTGRGITLTRKTCFQGSRGLTQVDPTQPYYEPPEQLEQWLKLEGPFFLNSSADRRLVPRGILAGGPPGTGKTEAAKWLASQLGVPLYRVDIGGTKQKFVGESEANLLAAFNQLDNEEPCVVLFDEIEKVFGGGEYDGGTTTSMLSQLLWWLAEHRSRVLTVMTTNNIRKLPPELYRSGRIDATMFFGGLERGAATTLGKHVLSTFGDAAKHVTESMVDKAIGEVFANRPLNTDPPTVAHASVTAAMLHLIKSKPPTAKLVKIKIKQ